MPGLRRAEHGLAGDGVTSDQPTGEGTAYRLPDAPFPRPGITIDAPVGVLDLDGGRIWDDQREPSQTRSTWTTERASGTTDRRQGNEEDAGGRGGRDGR